MMSKMQTGKAGDGDGTSGRRRNPNEEAASLRIEPLEAGACRNGY